MGLCNTSILELHSQKIHKRERAESIMETALLFHLEYNLGHSSSSTILLARPT